MPGTYSQVLLHVVFSTKHRERWISAQVAERLYPYIGGIVRAEKGTLLDVGGVEDMCTCICGGGRMSRFQSCCES